MLKTIAMYHAYTLFLPTNEFMDTIHQNMVSGANIIIVCMFVCKLFFFVRL